MNREFRRKFLTKFPARRMTFEICIYIYICIYAYDMYTCIINIVCMRVSWCLGFSRFLRVRIRGYSMQSSDDSFIGTKQKKCVDKN